MPSFADALNRSMETIKRPPPPPVGKYIARVAQAPSDMTSMTGRDGTSYTKLTIPLALVQPLEDVDPDDLAAYGAVTSTIVRLDFIFNESDPAKFEKRLDNLKNFIATCGVTFDGSEPLKQVLSRIANAQLIIELTHRLDSRDNETVYPEVGKYFPLA